MSRGCHPLLPNVCGITCSRVAAVWWMPLLGMPSLTSLGRPIVGARPAAETGWEEAASRRAIPEPASPPEEHPCIPVAHSSRRRSWCSASGAAPVSYTHLRAHETVLDLVCRLLLEKKKK